MARKIIACKIFENLIEQFISEEDELVYFEIDEHLQPEVLRAKLQREIDDSAYYEMLLLYGICGNATLGLYSGNHIVKILKIHDCTAALLGSNERFLQLFGDNLSQTWSSANYYKHSKQGKSLVLGIDSGLLSSREAYIEKYGEDNGTYLWDLLHPNKDLVYISMQKEEDDITLEKIEEAGIDKVKEIIIGSTAFLEAAIKQDDNLFILKEKEVLRPLYDFTEVYVAETETKHK